MNLNPGTLLQGGKYRIEKVLGQGSFGITYLATQTSLERKIAIKEFFMKELNSRGDDGSITGMSDGSLSYSYGQKFKKEARNLSRLDHPNIIHVIDSFGENGTYYYVMDYIEGENLNDYLKHTAVSLKEAIDIITSVAKALQYMHDTHHMLHLDLKPGNIMRRASDGHIFLIDFGLSKHYSNSGQPETSTTIGLGTPGYAPIEQSNQSKTDEFRPTIDVYALGATLFKLLTRETPPPASDIVSDDELIADKLRANGITGSIINIVVNAMLPNVRKRTQSVGEFISNLSTHNSSSDITTSTKECAEDEETLFTPDMQRVEDEHKHKESEIKAANERAEAEASAKAEAERLVCEEGSNKQSRKNIVYIFALLVGCILVAFFLLMPRQDSREPKRFLNTLEDSLAYCIGYCQTQGFYAYANDKCGVDTTRIDDIVEGLETGFWGGDHRKNSSDEVREKAYNFGMEIGKQMSEQMIKGLNYQIYGEDSTRSISSELYLAGFIAGVKQDCNIMNIEKALVIAEEKMREVRTKVLEIKYADNKKECEKFMKNIAHQSGIRALDSGVYYEVITQGNGEIPCDTSRVVVHYEGKLINDHVFDSSYSRGEPTIFQCNQVIPGWTSVLTHMPVGSKWRVYIPQEQAYGEREAGEIKPFSCLLFEIELLGIKGK